MREGGKEGREGGRKEREGVNGGREGREEKIYKVCVIYFLSPLGKS